MIENGICNARGQVNGMRAPLSSNFSVGLDSEKSMAV